MNAVTARQAVLSDLGDLAVLFDGYRQFQRQASDVEAALAFLRDRFDHGESVVFIGHLGNQPVGFAQLYPSFSSVSLSRVFVLNDLFVGEAGRQRGVATALLRAVEAYGRVLGASRLSLNVALSNLSAQRLYEAAGWHRDSEFAMFHCHPTASR